MFSKDFLWPRSAFVAAPRRISGYSATGGESCPVKEDIDHATYHVGRIVLAIYFAALANRSSTGSCSGSCRSDDGRLLSPSTAAGPPTAWATPCTTCSSPCAATGRPACAAAGSRRRRGRSCSTGCHSPRRRWCRGRRRFRRCRQRYRRRNGRYPAAADWLLRPRPDGRLEYGQVLVLSVLLLPAQLLADRKLSLARTPRRTVHAAAGLHGVSTVFGTALAL